MSEPKNPTHTRDEIDEVLDWCADAEQTGTNYGGMTYEQGVSAAIEWMQGRGENPKG